jgi:hypothetical protein
MKHVLIFCLFILALVMVQFSYAQTVDDVITKHIEAMGGKEKLMGLKTVKMEGSLTVQGFEVGVNITVTHNVGARTDISVPGMGDGFQITTPAKGWDFMPFQGQSAPEEVNAEQLQARLGQIDLHGSLMNYKEKGNTVELVGKEKVDGVECYKIKVTKSTGQVSHLFIDATTYYRIKVTSKMNVNGQDMETQTTYSDFKKTAEGYVFPFTQTTERGPIVFSSIVTNAAVDDKIYAAN